MPKISAQGAVDAILLDGPIGDVQAARRVAIDLLGDRDTAAFERAYHRLTLTAALLRCAEVDGEVARRADLLALFTMAGDVDVVGPELSSGRNQFVHYAGSELASLDPDARRRVIRELQAMLLGRTTAPSMERQNGQ